MTGLRKLSQGGMLRSSWHVLAVYIGASWVVLQVVETARARVPDIVRERG